MADNKPGAVERVAAAAGRMIDQFGKALTRTEVQVLETQIAAPSNFTPRNPFAGHLAFGINPARLGTLIRGADQGSTRDWFILCEEIEELYPHYSAVLAKRRRQVSLLPVTVVAAEGVADAEKHADFVRRWISRGVLQRAMFDITDAIGKGYTCNEIMWDCEPGCIWPAQIIWRHQRDFEVSWEDGESIWLRVNEGYQPLAPHKFLLHAHKSKSGGPARSGLTRMVAWMWMYQLFTLKDWALFVQGYGLPVRLGRYGPEASEEDKRTLWRAVRQIAGDLAAIIPKNMEMEFVEAKAAVEGAKLFEGRANWLNYEVSKLVLGGTAGTDAIAGGHAVGQEHRSAEQDVEKFDAQLLSGSVNRQIVQAMIAFNFGPQKEYPQIVIGTKERPPMSDVIAATADLGPLGFKVKASELRDLLQLTKPEDGDEVIGMPPAPAGGAVDENGNPLVLADVKPKANPHPEINPDSDTRALLTARREARERSALMTAQRMARAMQTAQVTPVLDALTARLEDEAGEALAAMTDEVKACFLAAEDLADLAARLKALKLDDTAFMTAMGQGMALANLAGQAALLDEIAPHR